jgi:hypothetical protein
MNFCCSRNCKCVNIYQVNMHVNMILLVCLKKADSEICYRDLIFINRFDYSRKKFIFVIVFFNMN